MHTLRTCTITALTTVLACSPGDSPYAFDVSALPLFWQTVDILAQDQEPTDEEWSRLFDHPGYQQIERSGRRATVLRDVMPAVFMPSREAGLDSLLGSTDTTMRSQLRRRVATHLVQVRERRDELNAYAGKLTGGELIGRAHEAALRMLPADRADNLRTPTVYVMLFEDNGFGGSAVAVDLLSLEGRSEDATIGYLGHELHHGYLGQIDRSNDPPFEDDLYLVVATLSALQWEGMASMVDKERFLDPNRAMQLDEIEREDATFFADAYRETPEILRQVDSILAGIHEGRLEPSESGRELRGMLPWGGHPNGMYMAKAIEGAFGRERLVAVDDPFTFLLIYQEAAASVDGAFRFSDPTLDFVRSLRERFVPSPANQSGRPSA